MEFVIAIEGVAIALLAVLVWGLLRSHALILRALHELGAGLELDRDAEQDKSASGSPGPVPVELEQSVVPVVERIDPHARDVTGLPPARGRSRRVSERSVPVQQGRTLLAFLSSGCTICADFWDRFRAGDVQVPAGAGLVVVTRSSEEESPSALLTLSGQGGVDVVMSSAAWTDYDIPGSPYFVYVEDGRIVGEGSATTWDQVSDLMRQAVADTPLDLSDDTGNAARMDAELAVAGIQPGHPSLYSSPDQSETK